MIHVIYISVIILIYLMFAFLYRVHKLELEKVTKEKDQIIEERAAIIQEADKKYEDLSSSVWENARTWEQTTLKFNAVVKERDEIINKARQRNKYLEHIVTEMVLLPK